MPRKTKVPPQKPIETYTHNEQERLNNPPVGLVTPHSDPEDANKRKTYQYDPHLDPQLQWAGKAEHTSFTVPTVSLHVHERIDPRTILEAVATTANSGGQDSLFAEIKPLRQALEFYKHKENWSNRLIAGDSLLVMNSLLEKEGMAGKVQMIYFDPPYGIKYGSNFQPFVHKRDVQDGKDEDLTREPEMIKAFRDTWELGIHSYLTYLRDRLLLARELLSDSGSIFVQISDENVHRVRDIMDEVFGCENFISQITMKRASVMFTKKFLKSDVFYLVFYAKNIENIKYRQQYINQDIQDFVDSSGSHLWFHNSETKKDLKATPEQRKNIKQFLASNKNLTIFATLGLNAQGTEKQQAFTFNGNDYYPPVGTQWKSSYKGLETLVSKNRIIVEGKNIRYKYFFDDYPVSELGNYWDRIGAAGDKIYVVQTNEEIIKRAMLMTTDPGDLVLDITCGSGTTAFVAEQWGRRWITCDTSRVALTLAKQRIMTAVFDYYQLATPHDGIAGGFNYKTVPHITLKSIANNEPPATEILYDQPLKDTSKHRITGPFTVEAVPAPSVKSLDDEYITPPPAPLPLTGEGVKSLSSYGEGIRVGCNSIARAGETYRHHQWRDELLHTGVRAKNSSIIKFSRIESLTGTKFIHAVGEFLEETKNSQLKTVLIVFGPEFAPLESRTVAHAIEEAKFLKPNILLFCAFMFEDEAAKDIDETPEQLLGFKLLKAQMNADLLTDDLRKNRSSNQSFWLIGQPDVNIIELPNNMLQVEILGFDYYNFKTGDVESGGTRNIALWLLDTDYDGRSLFPRQVFFPMSNSDEGWNKLAKNLKAAIDIEKIAAYTGTVSLPFIRKHKIAVKIVDDRGIESLRVFNL